MPMSVTEAHPTLLFTICRHPQGYCCQKSHQPRELLNGYPRDQTVLCTIPHLASLKKGGHHSWLAATKAKCWRSQRK